MPTGKAALYVTDTIASGNNQGFKIGPQGGQSAVFFERTQALNNQVGFTFEGFGPILATIAHSAAVGNAADGFSLQQGTVTITRSTASGNTTGLRVQAGAAFLSGTTLTNNSSRDFLALGTITSYGNNTLTGPAGNNGGSLTPAPLQ